MGTACGGVLGHEQGEGDGVPPRDGLQCSAGEEGDGREWERRSGGGRIHHGTQSAQTPLIAHCSLESALLQRHADAPEEFWSQTPAHAGPIADAPAAATGLDTGEQLPRGWIAQVDSDATSATYGRTFYVDTSTGISQWESPTDGMAQLRRTMTTSTMGDLRRQMTIADRQTVAEAGVALRVMGESPNQPEPEPQEHELDETPTVRIERLRSRLARLDATREWMAGEGLSTETLDSEADELRSDIRLARLRKSMHSWEQTKALLEAEGDAEGTGRVIAKIAELEKLVS